MESQAIAGAGICLVIGAAISFLVSFFKRFSFVEDHAKLVAFFISVLVGAATVLLAAWVRSHNLMTVDMDFTNFLSCIFVQFSASVATHEVVVNPISRNLVADSTTDVR